MNEQPTTRNCFPLDPARIDLRVVASVLAPLDANIGELERILRDWQRPNRPAQTPPTGGIAR